jgi:KDO2-lipid IV(A) lauroyltransferase
VSFLPRWFLYWAGNRMGDINYLLDVRGREAVKSNLRKILPPGTPESRVAFEARWVFRNFAKTLGEFFGYDTFGPDFIDRYVQMKGREHIDRALARGRGLIIATAHLGNWELGAATLARYGYEVWAIAQMHAHPKVNDLFISIREKRNYRILPMEKAARPAAKILKGGGLLCILGERNLTEGGIPVTFFGRTALFPQGPARLAVATGAPIVPGFAVRRANEGFTLCMEPELKVPDWGSRKEKVRVLTQEFASIVEEYIRWHPSQWGVFFRAWEEDPPGKVTRRPPAAAGEPDEDEPPVERAESPTRQSRYGDGAAPGASGPEGKAE